MYLTQSTGEAEEEDVVNDAGKSLREAQELPELPSEQNPWNKDPA